MKDQQWAQTMFDTAFAGPTREDSVEKLKLIVGQIREECAAVLGAEVMRLLGCRDREDAESIARASKLVRDFAAESSRKAGEP